MYITLERNIIITAILFETFDIIRVHNIIYFFQLY